MVKFKKINAYTQIRKKIKSNKLSIGVVGLGYVGLPISLSFALKKIKVFGIDNDKKKISKLKRNKSYINSVSEKILKKTQNKNFFPTTNFKIMSKCDVLIICVPTPIDKKKKTNYEIYRQCNFQNRKIHKKKSDYSFRMHYLSRHNRGLFPPNF